MAAKTPLPLFLIYTMTFALLSPIGIGIGIGVVELAQGSEVYYAITGSLQGEKLTYHGLTFS